MIESIKQKYQQADAVLILSGAGMSVDSGIPDFRGTNGVWTENKQNFIKFSKGTSFHEHALDSWNFYIDRFLKYSKAQPHQGYYDLKLIDKDVFVVTSNVDGFFKKAGYSSEKIYEIHGNLETIQCKDKCCRIVRPMPQFTKILETEKDIPTCEKCGAYMRPQVMMFNDPWFISDFAEQQSQMYLNWSQNKNNIIGIEIGAGLAVPSIRMFGEERTNTLVRINPYDYNVSRQQDISIRANAIDGITTLLKILGLKNE